MQVSKAKEALGFASTRVWGRKSRMQALEWQKGQLHIPSSGIALMRHLYRRGLFGDSPTPPFWSPAPLSTQVSLARAEQAHADPGNRKTHGPLSLVLKHSYVLQQ